MRKMRKMRSEWPPPLSTHWPYYRAFFSKECQENCQACPEQIVGQITYQSQLVLRLHSIRSSSSLGTNSWNHQEHNLMFEGRFCWWLVYPLLFLVNRSSTWHIVMMVNYILIIVTRNLSLFSSLLLFSTLSLFFFFFESPFCCRNLLERKL